MIHRHTVQVYISSKHLNILNREKKFDVLFIEMKTCVGQVIDSIYTLVRIKMVGSDEQKPLGKSSCETLSSSEKKSRTKKVKQFE